MLPKRPCTLDLDRHKYIWTPTGEEMTTSVTSVIKHGKPPVDYSKFPEAAPRGTHTHRLMEALATGEALPNSISPEGIDCSDWFEQLSDGVLNKTTGFRMSDFWKEVEVLACEYVMVDRKKSLGGSLDLLCVFRGDCWLLDLKTKGKSWTGPKPEDIQEYKSQAGGYLALLHSGDDAGPGQIVDHARTLVVTPTQVKFLPLMDVDHCYFDWLDCWDRYAASLDIALCPF